MAKIGKTDEGGAPSPPTEGETLARKLTPEQERAIEAQERADKAVDAAGDARLRSTPAKGPVVDPLAETPKHLPSEFGVDRTNPDADGDYASRPVVAEQVEDAPEAEEFPVDIEWDVSLPHNPIRRVEARNRKEAGDRYLAACGIVNTIHPIAARPVMDSAVTLARLAGVK